MGRKITPGLQQRNGIWVIDKVVFGTRICESTRTDSLAEAEKYLVRKIEQLREAKVYGVRPTRLFRQAATKYLLASQHKAGVDNEARYLKQLDRYIGHLPLEQIHDGTLEPFINDRLKQIKKKSVNLALGTVRHILNLAASKWKDENGLTWLLVAPKITMLTVDDAREPYPLSWDEQEKLFNELPLHLRRMALFKVNTGCREQEVCRLQWRWEIFVPELNTSVFLVPRRLVKDCDERLVVLNDFAKSVIEEVRGMHAEFVFTYQGHPVTKMNDSAWKRVRKKVVIPARVHDLKHTFGRRLRAAGVSFENRQDLLGYRSGRITTHYSALELNQLIAAANKVVEAKQQGILLTALRRKESRESIQGKEGVVVPLMVDQDRSRKSHAQVVMFNRGKN